MSSGTSTGSLVDGARPSLELVHGTVHGRARFRIAELHRNEGMTAAIEARLAGRPAIRTVRANPLTGSLLVQFDSEHPLDDIVALIEDELTAVVAAHIVSIPTNGGNGTPRAATTSSTWHTMTSDQVLEELAITAAVGLPSSTAVERLASDGPNCLPRPEFRSP